MAADGDSQAAIMEAAAQAFAGVLAPGARLIGIDLGTKTLGLALSDVTRSIASGLTTLPRTRFGADAERLLALAAEHGIGGFVIGLPFNLDGSQGPRVQATRAFARNLGKLTPLPILLWDERLTTAAAERVLLEADASRKRRAAGDRQGRRHVDPAECARPPEVVRHLTAAHAQIVRGLTHQLCSRGVGEWSELRVLIEFHQERSHSRGTAQ